MKLSEQEIRNILKDKTPAQIREIINKYEDEKGLEEYVETLRRILVAKRNNRIDDSIN